MLTEKSASLEVHLHLHTKQTCNKLEAASSSSEERESEIFALAFRVWILLRPKLDFLKSDAAEVSKAKPNLHQQSPKEFFPIILKLIYSFMHQRIDASHLFLEKFQRGVKGFKPRGIWVRSMTAISVLCEKTYIQPTSKLIE